jgi:hypothetical protein
MNIVVSITLSKYPGFSYNPQKKGCGRLSILSIRLQFGY